MSDIIREVEVDDVKYFAVESSTGSCMGCSLHKPGALGCKYGSYSIANNCRPTNPRNKGHDVIYIEKQAFLLKRLKGEL